jgi:site-specific DNA recombinase
MQTDELRVAIYARVSSERQAEAATIQSQIAALKERAAADGQRIEEELCFIDDGYTGSTLVRPALERLRDLVATGALDRVYVHSPDRLARKYAWQALLVDEFQRSGVELVFLNRALGQSPEDEMLLQMQGMMAEYERAKIMERSRRGKLHAARQGRVNVLGRASYGYRYHAAYDHGGEARYEIFLEEAQVVRQIFQWIGRERLSIGEVARRLKGLGIPSPRGKVYWDRSTLWEMLKNPAYKGTAAFGRTRLGDLKTRLRPYRGGSRQPRQPRSVCDVPAEQWILIPVPAIVDEALFSAVAEQLAENRKRNRLSRRGARHLLQGLVVCKQCGYAYYGRVVCPGSAKGNPQAYAYYRCTGSDAHRFGGQRVCSNTQVRADLLDAAVWQDVRSLLADPRRVEAEFQRRLTVEARGIEYQSRQQLEALIRKIQRGMARITDAYEDGLIDKREFEPRIRKARERLEKLKTEVKVQMDQEAQQRDLTLIMGRLEEFADRVRQGLDQADWPTKRQILRTLVQQVEIDRQEVRVVYRISPPPFVEPSSNQIMQDCWRRENAFLALKVSQTP